MQVSNKAFRIVVTDILGNRIVSVLLKDYPYGVSRIREKTHFLIEHLHTVSGTENSTWLTKPCITHFNTDHIVSITVMEEVVE
jgi:hypothetical protein